MTVANERERVRRTGAPALLLALALGGCCLGPPDLTPAALRQLQVAPSETGSVQVLFREEELPRPQAEALSTELEGVRVAVSQALGEATVPKLEVAVYVPCDGLGAPERLRTTEALISPGLVTFRYPLAEDEPRSRLLGTASHEAAEATVLEQVTTIDPYLRWLHDGIAEWVEHGYLWSRDRAEAQGSLRRRLEAIERAQEAGELRLDLERWRQRAEFLIRSHRFFDDGGNLRLDALEDARRQVRRALRSRPLSSERAESLRELDAMLVRAAGLAAQAERARPGEVLPEAGAGREFLYYSASLAYWLALERRRPGCVTEVIRALRARREGGDHVLSVAEAWSLVTQAAGAANGGPALPPLALELSWAEEVLEAELRAVSRDG